MELVRFLLQVLAVLATVMTCGRVARLLRQPPVVGEIAGGLLLGPSVLGRLAPAASAWLFPAAHLHGLELLSNAGVVLFLFVLGAELDLAEARRSARPLLLTAFGSVALPCAAGAALAIALVRFAPPHVAFLPFALFVGTALSVTALPVLGRILQDRAAEGRPVTVEVARLVLPVAALNDLAAWVLLLTALACAGANGTALTVVTHLSLLGAYAAVLVLAVRPGLQRLGNNVRSPGVSLLLACVAVAFISAWITDRLGLHAFSGAVLAGVCAPRLPGSQTSLSEQVRHRLRALLLVGLPVFFALTGLRTRLTVGGVWNRYMLAILAVAVFSKVLAGFTGARLTGMGWQWALEAGILLNTRGLVELVVLNVGLRAGVLSPTLFAMLVLMALATTAMTVPLLDLLRVGTTEQTG